MADITMCDGHGCPVKDKCYRHTAPKNDLWQSMFVAPPINEMDQCKYFWDNKAFAPECRFKEYKNGS